jgi:O-antigen/teichoic acid export membrane protein
MPRSVSLVKNFSWTLFGNLTYGVSQWLILVVIAKTGTPADVGRFALAFAVTAPFIMFANMNLRAVQATDARHQYLFGDYLAQRIAMLSAAILIIFLVVLISDYSGEVRMLIAIVCIAKTSESLSDLLFGVLQKHERMDIISISLFLKSVLSLIGLSIGLWVTHNIVWGIAGMAMAWILLLVCYDIPSTCRILPGQPTKNFFSIKLRPNWQWPTIKALTMMTLPLGIATLLNSLMTNIPRYVIEAYLGEHDLGIFAALAYIMIIGARVVTALGESASPRLARHYAMCEASKFKKLLSRMIVIGAATGSIGIVVAACAGTTILSLLYQQSYAAYHTVFTLLMIAAAFNYLALFLQYGMMSARMFRIQPYIISIDVAAMLLSCLILTPSRGLEGTAVSVIIGFAVQLACNAFVIWKNVAAMEQHVHGAHV